MFRAGGPRNIGYRASLPSESPESFKSRSGTAENAQESRDHVNNDAPQRFLQTSWPMFSLFLGAVYCVSWKSWTLSNTALEHPEVPAQPKPMAQPAEIFSRAFDGSFLCFIPGTGMRAARCLFHGADLQSLCIHLPQTLGAMRAIIDEATLRDPVLKQNTEQDGNRLMVSPQRSKGAAWET